MTSLEILSPKNKAPGPGRKLYLQKQKELLGMDAHVLEIDLLRGGRHTTAVPLKRLRREAEAWDYHICCRRFDRWEDFLIYPIKLTERLPVIAVPLMPEDGEVAVDLQEIFARAYDAGPYRRQVDYPDAKIVPRLKLEQQQWVHSLFSAPPAQTGSPTP